MQGRGKYSKSDFVQHFGQEADIAEEVWSSLSRDAAVDGFKPMPGDDLIEVFGLADEDLDDLVLELLQRCRCRIPTPSETAGMSPVQNVGDVVAFVTKMRQPNL
jgi:hypothetical protein